ncbi:MAG: LacI family DNA-binding transcriptional regulator [Anaerolinea sp.]|nr:LacI family DNA-binding transcriptional regulator [Anaerolinea sp.]
MKRPTQADVARIAGVSRATVSYVLNDTTDQRIPISPETRQRVLDAIAALGYEIDARAQALRSGETKTIGVLVPMYENPFFWQILLGIASEAEANGYSLLLAHNILTPEQQTRSIRELAEQRVDGLILMISFKELSESIMTQVRKSSRPIVELTASESEFDVVRQGYGDGARALMTHLFDLGHKRIGFLFGVTLRSQGKDRLTAYQYSLESAGLGVDDSLIIQCGEQMEDGYRAALGLLSRPDRPTALIAINDLLGIAAIRAAADLGLRVPDDVSIAGFDDITFTRYSVPRLTTVTGSPEQNGRDAVRLLLKRLAEPDRPQEVITADWRLHIRESTGRAP